LQGNPILINRFFQPFDSCGYFCNVLDIYGGWFSSAMETENDMLVTVRKGRPNVICDLIPDPFSMVIVMMTPDSGAVEGVVLPSP
jgi:hypothetical protein